MKSNLVFLTKITNKDLFELLIITFYEHTVGTYLLYIHTYDSNTIIKDFLNLIFLQDERDLQTNIHDSKDERRMYDEGKKI